MTATLHLEAARHARRSGDVSACIQHANVAVSASEQEHDPETAYHAYACMGRLHLSREEFADAVAAFHEAREVAKHGGLVRWQPAATYDLVLAHREAGNLPKARRLAATAVDLYLSFAPRHPAFTGLLADMAQCDFDQNRDCKQKAWDAVTHWTPCLDVLPKPHHRLNAAAQAMMGSAVLGQRARYCEADRRLEGMYDSLPHHEHAARTLAYASGAATMARDFERAATLGKRALLIAETRGEDWVAQRARVALSAALAERVAAL